MVPIQDFSSEAHIHSDSDVCLFHLHFGTRRHSRVAAECDRDRAARLPAFTLLRRAHYTPDVRERQCPDGNDSAFGCASK